MTTKVLVVGDGAVVADNRGINFLVSGLARPGRKSYVQDLTDWTFTVSAFISLLTTAGPDISVTTAQRNPCPGADIQNFKFNEYNLSEWDVLWLFGYEGYNEGKPVGSPICDSEVDSIEAYMNAGGGVFAAGDHEGMGSYMCGAIPRVRTMRLWWYNNDGNVPLNYPHTALTASGITMDSCNWPAVSGEPNNTWPPNSTSRNLQNRLDTIQKNDADYPELNAGNTSNPIYDFAWQSDGIAQELSLPTYATYNGRPHPILLGPQGELKQFPDHMHEGEVVLPYEPDDVEYPTKWSWVENEMLRPLPMIIATGTAAGNHKTTVTNAGPSCYQFVGDDTASIEHSPYGVLCSYDGAPIKMGRIVTDSSFHHYLDINIAGDPCSIRADTQAGFGNVPLPGSVLYDLQTFYVNTVLWLAGRDPQPIHLWVPGKM